MITSDIIALGAFVATLIVLIYIFAKGVGRLTGKVEMLYNRMDRFIAKHDDDCPRNDGTIDKIKIDVVGLKLKEKTCPARNGTINNLNKAVTDLIIEVARLNGGKKR